MWYVVNNGYFGALSTDYPKEYCYYIVKFNYNPYTLQEYFITDEIIIIMGEQVLNNCYIRLLIQGYKWYIDSLYGIT